MQNQFKTSTMLHEEERTAKWFLWVFYSIYLIYDFSYHYILPITAWGSDLSSSGEGLNYVIYIVMLALLPVAYYLMKINNPWLIKYIYFITFTLMNIINDIWIYWGNELPYSSGNVAELVIILFSPMFINKRFFNLVFFGTIAKLIVVGLTLQDPVVLLPLLLVVVLGIIAYILLHRFYSYVTAVKISYDKQLEGIVKGVIATLELKDPYTRGHSERVAEYAMMLAKATGKFKREGLTSFYYTCLLHDIGKIHIPDSILSKPARLTSEEFDIIKTHPVVGAKAVEQVEGIQEHIDVIRHHHERWDGKGYPDGLKGQEASLLTRVTAIADAFDAMTSSRSYRSALPVEEAYKRILEGKGTQFDPELVEVFQETYPTWVDYHNKYHDEKGAEETVPILLRR